MKAYDGRTVGDIKMRLLTAWRFDGVHLCGSACTLNRFTVLAYYHHFWLKMLLPLLSSPLNVHGLHVKNTLVM